jgi:hypothetical protein
MSSTQSDTAKPKQWSTTRSVWSARSLLPLSPAATTPKAPASRSHSIRFAKALARHRSQPDNSTTRDTRTARSVWSARSLLPLFPRPYNPESAGKPGALQNAARGGSERLSRGGFPGTLTQSLLPWGSGQRPMSDQVRAKAPRACSEGMMHRNKTCSRCQVSAYALTLFEFNLRQLTAFFRIKT